jgi:hypothetical protein
MAISIPASEDVVYFRPFVSNIKYNIGSKSTTFHSFQYGFLESFITPQMARSNITRVAIPNL